MKNDRASTVTRGLRELLNSPLLSHDSKMLIEVAIDYVSKDIPKKPITQHDNELDVDMKVCPYCDGVLYNPYWYYEVMKRYHQSRCLRCGQKLTQPANLQGEWLNE